VVPRNSNHRLADIARARALRDLVAAGGRVLLAPGMVHAKAILVDDALALSGSLNLDSRSLFLNFELMMAFYSSEDISALSQWMDVNFSNLKELQPVQPSLIRDTGEGLVRWLGFQI
jgi:cardiolipin synthase